MMLPCRTERRRLKDLVKLFGLLLGSSDVISYNPPRVRVFRKRSSFFFSKASSRQLASVFASLSSIPRSALVN